MCSCKGLHRRKSLRSSSRDQLICLTRMVFDMKGKRQYNTYFCGVLLPGFFSKQHASFFHGSYLVFSAGVFLELKCCNHIVALTQPYCYILSEITYFHMIDSHAFPMHMLTYCLVDEILLPGYVNGSINFWGFLLNGRIAPSCLKLRCICKRR